MPILNNYELTISSLKFIKKYYDMFEKSKLEVNFFTKFIALAELDKDTLVNVIGIISEKSDIRDLPKKIE